MNEPTLIINTDDALSMNSDLEVTVMRSLNRIRMRHIRQNGDVEIIQLYPSQINDLCNFLLASKRWIEGGYNEKQKPFIKNKNL